MKFILKSFLTLMVFLAFSHSLFSQSSGENLQQRVAPKNEKWHASFQWMALTIHPGGGTFPQYYRLKLDKRGTFIAHIGGIANIDYDLNKKFFLRGSFGAYTDCATLPQAFLHLGFRFTGLKFGRHEFNAGLGPTFIIRESWFKFPEYQGGDFFDRRVVGKYQYRFVPYGGEFEYLYKINDKWQFQYSVIPAYPVLITSKIGFRMKW